MKKSSFSKVIAVLLSCMVLAMSALACTTEEQQAQADPPATDETPAEDTTQEEPADDTNQEEPAADSDVVIGFAHYSLADPYCATLAEGAMARAEELGIELNVVDGKLEPATQMTAIENFITLGVDGILTLPIDSAAVEDVIQQARDQGIPVIANSIPAENANIFVSATNFDMGYNIGKACAEWLNANKDGGGKIAYLNNPQLTSLIERDEAFYQAIEELCPGAEIVMTVPGGSVVEDGLNAAETILQAYPDIDAIVSCNDAAAIGACNAVEAAGIDPAGIFIGGVDAIPEAIAKIKEGGPYKATVDNVPFENGKLLIDLMLRLLDGEEIDYNYELSTKIVDSSNIGDY